ncbi:MAG: hypothetical protein KA436_10575 [Oligoflexales bacterium]|nr:hypothetical protein [Oligoflexales bacterium]
MRVCLPVLLLMTAFSGACRSNKKSTPAPAPVTKSKDTKAGTGEAKAPECLQNLALDTLPTPSLVDSSLLKTTDLDIEAKSSPSGAAWAEIHVKKDPEADIAHYSFCPKGSSTNCTEGIMRRVETNRGKNPSADINLLVKLEGRLLEGFYAVEVRSCVWSDLEKSPGKKQARRYGGQSRDMFCGLPVRSNYSAAESSPELRALFIREHKDSDGLHHQIGNFAALAGQRPRGDARSSAGIQLVNVVNSREQFNLLVESPLYDTAQSNTQAVGQMASSGSLALADAPCTPIPEVTPPPAPKPTEDEVAALKKQMEEADKRVQEATVEVKKAPTEDNKKALADAKLAEAQAMAEFEQANCEHNGGVFSDAGADGRSSCAEPTSGAPEGVVLSTPAPVPHAAAGKNPVKLGVGIGLMALGSVFVAAGVFRAIKGENGYFSGKLELGGEPPLGKRILYALGDVFVDAPMTAVESARKARAEAYGEGDRVRPLMPAGAGAADAAGAAGAADAAESRLMPVLEERGGARGEGADLEASVRSAKLADLPTAGTKVSGRSTWSVGEKVNFGVGIGAVITGLAIFGGGLAMTVLSLSDETGNGLPEDLMNALNEKGRLVDEARKSWVESDQALARAL